MKQLIKNISLFIFFNLLAFGSFSQKQVESTGEAELELFGNSSPEQTKLKVVELAKINAIENVFGQVVLEGNSLYTVNKQQNAKVEFNQVFNSISDVYVNGEWIKDLKVPNVETITKNNKIFYKANVKGIVRELKPALIRFEAKSLSCPKKTCATEEFFNEQDFYLYFKSPVDGFIAVFLDFPTEQKTYCLLPSKSNGNGEMQVKANSEYFFFSKENKPNPKEQIDEIQFTLTDAKVAENNKLFILFSPETPLGKPVLNNAPNTKTQQEIIDNGYELPEHMPSEEFQKWLQELRSRNKNVELTTKYLLIKPGN